MKLLSCLILIFASLASAEERLSLKTFVDQLKNASEISTAFKALSAGQDLSAKDIEKWLKVNQKNKAQLQGAFGQAKSFVRGEIEDEKNLSGLITYVQLAILEIHLLAQKNDFPQVQKNLESWFSFAADFPYEESSLVGLRASSVVRSFFLDELERLQSSKLDFLAGQNSFRKWLSGVRAPWPVDRMVVSESKKIMGERSMKTVEKLAQALQKNPYQSSEKLLVNKETLSSKELEVLRQLWRDSDIKLMKSEISRIGRLQLAFADRAFELINKKKPESVQDLIKAGLLERAPIDYETGKALTLTR